MPKYNQTQGSWEPDDSEIDTVAEQALLLKATGKAPVQPAPSRNPILFNPDLVERAFGSNLLSVKKLTEWAAKHGLEVATEPPIEGFQFVQVEAFLCGIERAASSNTPESMAAAIVQSTPQLANDRAAEVSPCWLVGADAHQQWRRLLERAVEAGELALLHFGSKLPIDVAPEQTAATPAPMSALGDEKQSIERIRYKVLASRSQLIETFGYYGVELKIFKALKDRPGLLAACKVKGKGHKGSRAEPMFCPFEVINWLVKTGVKEKPRLKEFMGWHILETKFQDVYSEKSMCDPRQN